MKVGRWLAYYGILAIICTHAFASGARAEWAAFQLPKTTTSNIKLKVNLPSAWWGEPDLLGAPLALLGPLQSGARPVLLVVPLEGRAGIDEITLFQGADEEYRSGREAWLQEVGGTATEYLESHQEVISGVHSSVRGYRYALEGQNYLEKVYLIACNRHLIYATLLLTAEGENQLGVIEKLFGSMSCE